MTKTITALVIASMGFSTVAFAATTNPPATAQGPSNGANVTPGGATGANVSATATGLAGGGLATAAGVLAALGLAVAVGGGNNGVVTTTTTTK